MRRKLLPGIGLVLLAAVPVLAHHSFAAQYDRTKSINFKGKVTKLEWMNPHVYFYVDVDEGGKVTNYACEAGAPNSLYRQGWRKDALKTGDMVSVEGWRAKDGTNTVNGGNITLPDGKKVFAGSPDDGGPGAGGARRNQ